MCDQFSQMTMSSSTPLPSLTSTVLPSNAIAGGNDSSQFNYLINLITIPIDSINFENNQKMSENIDTKKLKHRQTERIRHKKIVELMSELSQVIGVDAKHETQSNILTRAARYALFLSYMIEKLEKQLDDSIQISSDDWFLEMHRLYSKAYEKVKLLTNSDINSGPNDCDKRKIANHDQVEQTPSKEYSGHHMEMNETLPKTPDHCLPLKKRAKMIMFSDFQNY